jgi:O-acetylhomoserine/O-acetylserine sulfhydrylase-like pyridoxal-dependent enzyme
MFRLVTINGRAALDHDGSWYDLAELAGDAALADPLLAVARHRELHALYERTSSATSGGLVADAVLDAPVPRPRQSFGIGLNYRDHAGESGAPLPPAPLTFTKFPSCIAGPTADVPLSGTMVDWEVEIVAVIGDEASHVSVSDAWNVVAGLTLGQDISDRAVQLTGVPPQFCLGKSFGNFGPIGPALMSIDAFADPDDIASFEKAVTPKTKAIFIESIANPGGVITDIEAVSKIARKAGVPLIVDNTLATPYLCKPFDYGANIVVHSLTKFLGGHGNSIGGLIVDGGTFNWLQNKRYPMLSEPRPEYSGMVLGETFGNFAFAIACRVLGLRDLGPALSPFNAFLIITGIETLPLRMQRHSDNALVVAQWLQKRAEVAWVSYPGLAGDKYNTLAKKYVPKGAGAVFTFGLKGGYDAGVKLVSNVKLFSHLANIGDTRSLIIHPASTTHKQLSDAQKVQAGAGPDVVRLSIGLEDTADIIADLEQGLTAK